MVLDFSRGFSTLDGQQQFGRKIASMIREDRCEPAMKGLYAAIARYPSPVADAVAATKPDTVEIEGWQGLNAALLSLDADFTALGINLSTGSNWSFTPEGWAEPTIECGYFTDDAYPFTRADRTELLAAELDGPPAWRGAMQPLSAALEIFGLAQLNSALSEHEPQMWPSGVSGPGPHPAPNAFVAFELGEWLRLVLFNRAVKRGLDRYGLVRRMPVLVAANDVNPFVESVYFTDAVYNDLEGAERRNADKQIAAKLQYDAYTLEQVELMRQRRQQIREWDPDANPAQRETLIAFAAAHEKTLLASQNLSARMPSWELPDDEFETLVDSFQAARDPDFRPTWRSRPKNKPKGLFQRFGFARGR